MKCGREVIENPTHDYCYDCYKKLKNNENGASIKDSFEEDLDNKIYTVYVMFYEDKEKIGYTNDLNSRIIEIKREFPHNKLVYFREFIKESEAREFESWLKNLHKRMLMKFIAIFQDKLRKVEQL